MASDPASPSSSSSTARPTVLVYVNSTQIAPNLAIDTNAHYRCKVATLNKEVVLSLFEKDFMHTVPAPPAFAFDVGSKLSFSSCVRWGISCSILLRYKDKYLFHRRQLNDKLFLSLPGGELRLGEDLVGALQRGLRESVNLEVYGGHKGEDKLEVEDEPWGMSWGESATFPAPRLMYAVFLSAGKTHWINFTWELTVPEGDYTDMTMKTLNDQVVWMSRSAVHEELQTPRDPRYTFAPKLGTFLTYALHL